MGKLDFSKGINNREELNNTPGGFYWDALNIRTSGSTKKSEEGTLNISGVPTNLSIVGTYSIENDIIVLCYRSADSSSVIGKITKDDAWEVIINFADPNDPLLFKEPIQVEGKIDWKGDYVLYFSSNGTARRVNLTEHSALTADQFDVRTRLFLNYTLPSAEFYSMPENGTLLSGTYVFAARLVTDTGSATPFGLLSGPIPVVDDSLRNNRDDITGCPPQTPTNKAIDILVENIDPEYKYIQLGIVTYIGMANVPVVYVANEELIQGSTRRVLHYRGSTDNIKTIPLEEFIVSGVHYKEFDFVAQKDNTLLIGAPVETPIPPVDWFRLASNIQAEYVIKEIPFSENLQFDVEFDDEDDTNGVKRMIETSVNDIGDSYKNPETVSKYKGYRRDEVYSFSITPVMKTGQLGPTVHIPAMHQVNTPAVGGVMGTFISGHSYPDDRYPNLNGQPIRLHKFPTIKEEPIYTDGKIRVLGIKFTGIELDPSESQYADQIAGYIIGMVDRVGNETQLAQGIAKPVYKAQFDDNVDYSLVMGLGSGKAAWTLDWVGGQSAGNYISGDPILNSFGFLAPDYIHGLYETNSANGIKEVSVYKSQTNKANTDFYYDTNHRDSGRTYPYFEDAYDISSTEPSNTKLNLVKTPMVVEPFGSPGMEYAQGGQREHAINYDIDTITMCSSEGFVWMKTDGDIRDPGIDWRNTQISGSNTHNDNFEIIRGESELSIYSTYIKNDNQYGPLDLMVYMEVDYHDILTGVDTNAIFHGDTFITKYGLTVGDETGWPYSTDDKGDYDFLNTFNLTGIVYFWLESSNNYDYRHYIDSGNVSLDEVKASTGSVPFYPAYKRLVSDSASIGILALKGEGFFRVGYASQYNNQYGAQANLKPYANTPPEDIIHRQLLTNRILYSAGSVEGEKIDAYQIFAPNNFYDVPRTFGVLTDIYINGELFATTAQVIWKLFYNTMATQATSAGEVVLGTGGAFNRPAIPLTTIDGGYAGLSHWTHSANSSAGRVFVDKISGLVFNSPVSGGLQELFRNLDFDLKYYIQNLADNNLIRLGVELLNNRVFIRVGIFTYSYSFSTNEIVSRHSFTPAWMFNHGTFMYSQEENSIIAKHSVGPTGVYYGIPHKCSISLIANEGGDISKLFRVLEIVTKSERDSNNSNKPFSTFDRMEVWNEERYTGKISIRLKTSFTDVEGILEELTEKVKDSFRIAIPPDIVVDPHLSIFDENNHAQKPSDTKKASWLPKMRGNYVIVKLTKLAESLSDADRSSIELISAKIEINQNIR